MPKSKPCMHNVRRHTIFKSLKYITLRWQQTNNNHCWNDVWYSFQNSCSSKNWRRCRKLKPFWLRALWMHRCNMYNTQMTVMNLIAFNLFKDFHMSFRGANASRTPSTSIENDKRQWNESNHLQFGMLVMLPLGVCYFIWMWSVKGASNWILQFGLNVLEQRIEPNKC